MKHDANYEKLLTCSGKGGFYVPFGRTVFSKEKDETGKESTEITLWEILDDELHTIGWYFADRVFAEKNKKSFIGVGELFLDFYHESIEFCNINRDRNISPDDRNRLDKLHNSLLSVYKTLSSGTKKEKNDLLRDFAFEQLCRCSQLAFRVSPILDNTQVGHEYCIPTKYGGLEAAFFTEDLAKLIQHPNIKLDKCVHCGKLYIRTKKGQKYCPECVQAKISEKLRRENMTEQCRLRQKIYSRLYVRDGSGNNWDYGYDIYDGDSFTKVASEYKRNHTKVEYLEWLREIEKLTKRDSLSIEKLASDYKRNHTKDEYLEWLKEIEKITK